MKIALRMDDVGASSKKFEIYSKNKIGNLFFLKYYWPFKAWGPYEELSVKELVEIFDILNFYKIKLTFGITACWVDNKSNLVPYNEKFPNQAKIVKQAVLDNIINIANHGLTHCIPGKHLPRLILSNRKYHREFWDWIDQKIHEKNIKQSQEIFQNWLGFKPKTFVPPGNVYSKKTLRILNEYNFKYISTNKIEKHSFSKLRFIPPENVIAFHDRELKIYGKNWLKSKIIELKNKHEIVPIENII